MHKTVIKQVDKYRKHCLWRGADINANHPKGSLRHGLLAKIRRRFGGVTTGITQ
jgi:hypothetical protein